MATFWVSALRELGRLPGRRSWQVSYLCYAVALGSLIGLGDDKALQWWLPLGASLGLVVVVWIPIQLRAKRERGRGLMDGLSRNRVSGVADRGAAAERLGVDPAYYLAARRRVVGRLVVILGSSLLGGVVVVLLVSSHEAAGRHTPWWFWLLVPLGPVVLAALTGVIGWHRVTRSATFRELSLAGPYGTAKSVRRAILHRQQLPPDQRPTAQVLVNGTRRSIRRIWMWAVLGAVWIAMAVFFDGNGWERWFRLGLGVAYLALTAQSWISSRRLLRRAAEQGLRPEPSLSTPVKS